MSYTIRTKTIVAVLSVTAILIFALGFSVLTDSHRTNPKYIMWKRGWIKYSPEVALRYINVDVDFQNSLLGKTKSEVEKYFPDLRPVGQSNYYQQSYNEMVRDLDFYWIGDSHWGIEFHNGKVKEFILLKG